MITKNEFYQRVKALPKQILSKRGKRYSEWDLQGNILHFTRMDQGTRWNLDVDVLYNVYKQYAFINTTVVKNATNRKVNSPSVAILKAIKCIDQNGNRLK